MTATTLTVNSEHALFSGPELQNDKSNGIGNKTQRDMSTKLGE